MYTGATMLSVDSLAAAQEVVDYFYNQEYLSMFERWVDMEIFHKCL